MPVLRLLNKEFSKTKFKRVSEYCFNLHHDDNEKERDIHLQKLLLLPQQSSLIDENVSIRTSLIDPVCNALPSISDAKFVNNQQKLSLSAQLEPFSRQIRPMHMISSNVLSQPPTCSTDSVASCSTDQSSNIQTAKFSSSAEQSSGKNDGSVLGSMGIDREPNSKSSDSENEKTDENKQKEEDNKETPFLRSQRYAKWMMLATFGIGTPMFIIQHGAPEYDDFGEEIKDQYSDSALVIAYIRRAWGEINLLKREIVEPSSKKLLPDPLSEPYYQPPYTLVIELMDVFLRPVYDSVTGWRFKKRPGIDYFLSQVGPPLFEVVIFTRETGMTAFPLIDSMDQKGYIMYRLFRDAARYKSGFSIGNPLAGEMPKLDPYYQKDLTYLNRDLSKVIMVDCDKRAFEKQPENGLNLEKWDGSSNDTTLYDLAGLLRAIATSNVEDVRPVLQHYAATDKPIETFKMAQAKIQEDSRYAPKVASSSSLLAGAGSTVSAFIRRR